MIEVATDVRDTCPKCKLYIGEYLRPATEDSLRSLKGLELFEVFKAKIYGIKKPRSVRQLNTYWACCSLVAELLSDHENLLDKHDVDFQYKINIAKKDVRLMKRFQVINGITYIEPISISFANLKHLDACKYFDKALKMMAEDVKMKDVNHLIFEAKQRMS